METTYRSPRQKRILSLLAQKNDWVKGAEIAAVAGVTTRTLRSDIRELNVWLNEQGSEIESSNTKGYRLTGAVDFEKPQAANATPVAPEERVVFILKRLIAAQETIDGYALADELLVSESTFENDLKRVKLYLGEHAPLLELSRRAEWIELVGGERERRTLFGRLLFAEAGGNFLGLSNYEAYFPKVKEIQRLLLDCFERHTYAANEMGAINLIVHIAITIERIRGMNLLCHASSLAEFADTVEAKMAEELCAAFKQRFGIDFPPQERLYLMYLISAKKQVRNVYHEREELRSIVPSEVLTLTERLLTELAREFGIDLNDDDALYIGLALHVTALRERLRHRGRIQNPLLDELKRRYPSIFEMAVFMAECFRRETGLAVHEDEIGFFTLHLGAALERFYERTTRRKRVALVCPSGSTSTEILLSKLRQVYQNKIEIVGVFSFLESEKLAEVKPDFIFATVRFEHALEIPTIVISPFLDKRDVETINKSLNLWESTARKESLEVDLETYFSDALFYSNPTEREPFALLSYLADDLFRKGFVPDSYRASVLERERISSTSFNHWIAIPHAVEMNAYRTAVAVARFDKPIVWGEHKVQLVLLFAIKAGERKQLSDLYKHILQIIDGQEGVLYLAQAQTCQDFKERVLHWTSPD